MNLTGLTVPDRFVPAADRLAVMSFKINDGFYHNRKLRDIAAVYEKTLAARVG